MPGIVPTQAVPGYTSDGTIISFTIASLGITAAQAHPATGDFRIILSALLRVAIKNIVALATQPTLFRATTTRTLVDSGTRIQVSHTVQSTYENNDATLAFPADPPP
jgi:hypothetical protein